MNMIRGLSAGIGAATLVLVPLIAMAEDAEPWLPGELSANVSITTDYVFRGFSQTDEDPAIQGGLDYAHPSGAYVGVWASNVDFNDGDEAHLEMDAYLGYANEVGAFSYDVGGIYYGYPGAGDDLNYDFFELAASFSYDLGVASVTASVNWSPDYFGESGDAFYPGLTVEAPIVYGITASAHYHYQFIEDNATFGAADYSNWGASVSRDFPELWGLSLSAAYEDTSVKSTLSDATFIFTAGKSF